MTPILRLLALMSISALAACATTSTGTTNAPPQITVGYEAVEDEGIVIEAVEARHLTGGRAKSVVAYNGPDPEGSIVVDTHARKLYYIMPDGKAMRYSVAVGREGLSFRGSGVIGRKQKWPSWQPTANMIRTRPDLYAEYAGGMSGGIDNPLGARAMYLYRGGRDTLFRIHGTVQNATIGHATSAGCIRLYNQDAMDLFERVSIGSKVKVRSLEESVALEGPYMDDAWGLAVPETPANIARKEKDAVTKVEQETAEAAAVAEAEAKAAKDKAAYDAMTAEQKAKADAKAAKEAAKAEALATKEAEKAAKIEKNRLAACTRKGISDKDCPALAANG